ncbi:MAG: YncE family protein [Candidatus Eisenbacteria bacterium]
MGLKGLLTLAVVLLISGACFGQVQIRDVLPFVGPDNARSPWGVDVDEARNLAYVTGYETPYRLAVIDGATHEIVNNIALSGIFPRGLCFYPALDRIYVANSGSSTVSVVDAEVQTETATIPVGNAAMDICINTSTGLLYVVNEADGTVSVLDASTNSPVDTIMVGSLPYDICANSATNRIYAANRGDRTVSVIDGAMGQVIATIPVGDGPSGICVNQASNLIYVAERHENAVSVIDGVSNQLIHTIPVGRAPYKVCADSVRNLVYVVNTEDENIFVIDGASDAVMDTVRVGHYPLGGIAVNSTANKIYVPNSESQDVSVIDGVAREVVATVRVAWFPHETSVDPSSGKWFVTNSSGNDVACLESGIPGHLWDAGIGYSPGASAFCNWLDGVTVDRLYVACIDSVLAGDKVMVLDGHSGNALDTIPVGNTPQGLSVNHLADRLYVANNGDSNLYVLRASTGDLLATVSFPEKPMDVEVNTVTNIVYVPTWFGMLYAIEGWTNTVIDSIMLHGFCEPNHIAVNEVSNKIYVTSLNCTVVWVVDGEDLVVEATLPTTSFPDKVAVNELLGKAYVCTGKYLTVIAPDNTISQEVWLLKMTGSGCSVREDSSLVYVGCPWDGEVIVLWDEDIACVGGPVGGIDSVTPVLCSIAPNPCCGRADVSFSIAAWSEARLEIHDITGSRVRILFEGQGTAWLGGSGGVRPDAGAAGTGVDGTVSGVVTTGVAGARMVSGTVSWDGTNSLGSQVAPGIYFVRLESGETTLTRKICKLR